MNKLIAKCYDFRQVWNARRQSGVQLGQLIERFANDFKFALYRRLRHLVGCKSSNVHSSRKSLDP